MSDNNSAKGRDSHDMTTGNLVVSFFNRNSTPYPTEVGSVKFEPVPIREYKDLMLNTARMNAQQEYNRIMELVHVLEKQAQDILKRLEITDLVHNARYNFKPVHGNIYWLVEDTQKSCIILSQLGPNDWSTGAPAAYKYIQPVKYLGDSTWIKIEEKDGNI